VLNFYEKLDLGAIFDFEDFQKGTSWTPFSATKAPNCTRESSQTRFFRDSAFHETIVILVPLGHRGFQKIIFLM
jgi:hypothetical protein